MKKANEIFEEMKSVFAEKCGYEISDDCDMAVRMYAAASQTEALYIYGGWILRQCFPQSAEGQYLDSHGFARNILRKAGEKAKGEISFFVNAPAKNDIYIPAGTVCMTASGISFETLSSGIIAAGEKVCTVSACALETGKEYNVPRASVIFMTNAPLGVEGCTNASNFTGGADEESDEALRARILESYRALSNGANAAWYEKTALAVAGVADVSVVPCARGVGTVDVVITSNNGLPSDELIANVQNVFEEKREICVDVQVCAPNVLNVNIEAQVMIKAGYDAADVLNSVREALAGMFDGKYLARKLYTAEICDRIYHTEGVLSYKLISPDYDMAASENMLLNAGEIKISRWE